MDESILDCYAALSVSRDATGEEIRRSYRRLMRSAHTDLVGDRSHDSAARLNLAYEIVRDPARRAAHDRKLRECDPYVAKRDGAETKQAAGDDPDPSPSSWGQPTEWDDLRDDPNPSSKESASWGEDQSWEPADIHDEGRLRTAWTDECDTTARRRFQRWMLALKGAGLVLALPILASLLIPFLTQATNPWPSAISNGVVSAGVAAIAAWLIWRRRVPVVGIVVSVLTTLPFLLLLAEGLIVGLFLALLYSTAIIAGIVRRRRRRYLAQFEESKIWERIVNDSESRGRPLRWIVQAVPVYQGRKTNALTEIPATGLRENLWIWGDYRSGLWIDYVPHNQSVASWATDSCRQSWAALNGRALNMRQQIK